MPVRIDAPVVVKPEIVSKNASVKSGKCHDKKNGIDPTNEAASQLKATIRNPSLAERLATFSFLKKNNIKREINITGMIVLANALISFISS